MTGSRRRSGKNNTQVKNIQEKTNATLLVIQKVVNKFLLN
jgi:hypothetical protein